jgi:hypothetical protein
VHVAAFGTTVGLDQAQLQDTASERIVPDLWSERERILLQVVDELHETATLSDATWEQFAANWSVAQMLEVLIIAGWYHLIAFVANAARVEGEPWAAHFPQRRAS